MLLLQVGLLIVELLNLLQQRLKFGELGRNDLLLTLLYSKVIHLDVAFIASSALHALTALLSDASGADCVSHAHIWS